MPLIGIHIGENASSWTTRSVRSLLTWARDRVRSAVTDEQWARAEPENSVDVSDSGFGDGWVDRGDCRFTKTADAHRSHARTALAFWFRRAGINDPWRAADGVDPSSAPELKRPKPRVRRPRPKRDEAAARVDLALRKLQRKAAHVEDVKLRVSRARSMLRSHERALRRAKQQQRQLAAEYERAREAMLAREPDRVALSDQDFATRMRARRQGAAPTAR